MKTLDPWKWERKYLPIEPMIDRRTNANAVSHSSLRCRWAVSPSRVWCCWFIPFFFGLLAVSPVDATGLLASVPSQLCMLRNVSLITVVFTPLLRLITYWGTVVVHPCQVIAQACAGSGRTTWQVCGLVCEKWWRCMVFNMPLAGRTILDELWTSELHTCTLTRWNVE